MIQINNVTKCFGDFTAIENINLTINKSSIYGIVGYNGAGKTTLLKTIVGMYKPEKGSVLINGENVYDNGVVRSDIFFIPDNLYLPAGYSLKKLKAMYKGYYPNFSDKVYANMLEAMGLDEKKSVASFSKGMQRQAQIILAMATMPKCLILDECFDGIDPQKRNMCKKIFIEYMAETECSIVMSSHNLQEIADLCDRVALINGKTLAMDVSVDDISSAYVKYRMIFADDVDASIFDKFENKGITIDGKMATIIVSSDLDVSEIESLEPIHYDVVSLSLEEVFLNEMEDKDYDISKIFLK